MTLAFRLGSIPVRIQPWFFLMAVILGMSGINRPVLLVAWIVVVLVAVMAHELGHALCGMAFGLAPQIELHGMGGTTSWREAPRGALSPWRSVAVSVAGPLVGIVFGGVALAIGGGSWSDLLNPLPVDAPMQDHVLRDWVWANAGWGLLNLIPMLPLDGGNVLLGILNGVTKGRGEKAARWISVLIAVGLCVLCFVYRQLWPAALTGLFAFQNFRALREKDAASADEALRPELDRAYDALRAMDGARVVSIAGGVASRAKSDAVRAEAMHMAAFGELLLGRVDRADALVAGLPPGFRPNAELSELRARVVAEQGGRGHDGGLLIVRRAALADEAAVFALVRELGYAGDDRRAFAEVFATVLGDPAQRVFIADDAGRVMGMLAMSLRPQIRLRGTLATVDEMVVVENDRGSGVGRALLDEAKAEAARAGARRVELHTQRARESYRRGFYAKNGFVEIDSAVMRLG